MTVLVRCGSHRAHERLQRLCGKENVVARMTVANWPPTHGYEIPAEHLEAALKVKMVTRWNTRGQPLHNPW